MNRKIDSLGLVKEEKDAAKLQKDRILFSVFQEILFY